MSVLIVTSLGDIVVDLFTYQCPLTCKNFLKLCKIKYYNGCLFHTVQKDFTAQTGDPTGTGSGGDSVYKFLYGDQARFFHEEIHSDLKHSKIGSLAMANAGENLNASQFYITLGDDLGYLDGKHTVFGEIAEGLETLARINEVHVDGNSRPYKNIRIKHIYILDDPFEDPPQLAQLIPDASPQAKPKDDEDVRLEDDWISVDEQLNAQELEEMLRQQDAHSRAVVLELIGDVPDAEMRPPENVLFVCKLNSVTDDEDLHMIFSRFGVVTSVEIVRDHKTGESRCYAFVEFEDRDACERAYSKMDNAVIDDRRIRVDFSQSVAKLWSARSGCFNCPSLDDVFECIRKDDNTQRGGDGSTGYEMVFDEDDDGGSRHSKRRRRHNDEQYNGKQNSKRRDAYKSKDLDERRSWKRRHERTKERRQDEGYARRQTSPYSGGARDYPEKNGSSDGEHKRRHENDVNHKHRRETRR